MQSSTTTCRHAIEKLLTSLPQQFDGSIVHGSAVGSALCCSLACLVKTIFLSSEVCYLRMISVQAGRGGRVTTFVASPLVYGRGTANPRELPESTLYGTDKEKTLFAPTTGFWKDLGEECAEEGVSVNLFLAPSQPIDIGSLSKRVYDCSEQIILIS